MYFHKRPHTLSNAMYLCVLSHTLVYFWVLLGALSTSVYFHVLQAPQESFLNCKSLTAFYKDWVTKDKCKSRFPTSVRLKVRSSVEVLLVLGERCFYQSWSLQGDSYIPFAKYNAKVCKGPSFHLWFLSSRGCYGGAPVVYSPGLVHSLTLLRGGSVCQKVPCKFLISCGLQAPASHLHSEIWPPSVFCMSQ